MQQSPYGYLQPVSTANLNEASVNLDVLLSIFLSKMLAILWLCRAKQSQCYTVAYYLVRRSVSSCHQPTTFIVESGYLLAIHSIQARAAAAAAAGHDHNEAVPCRIASCGSPATVACQLLLAFTMPVTPLTAMVICRSPQHDPLQGYFEQEVPAETHILYTGATRFGWGRQRRRYSYAFEEVCSLQSHTFFVA